MAKMKSTSTSTMTPGAVRKVAKAALPAVDAAARVAPAGGVGAAVAGIARKVMAAQERAENQATAVTGRKTVGDFAAGTNVGSANAVRTSGLRGKKSGDW